MARGLDGEELGARGNEFQRGGKFVESAEAVARSVDEEGQSAKVWKVSGARLVWALGRVKGIGQQEQRVGEARRGCCEHGSLAAAVGMAAEENAAGCDFAESFNSAPKTELVAPGAVAWWAGRTVLTEWEIDAKDGEPRFAERVGDRDEQWGLAV